MVRHIIAAVLIGVGFGGFAVSQVFAAQDEPGRHAALVEVDGVIEPVTVRFLSRAIDDTAEDGAEVLIVRLDTPGGLISSTREIVEEVLAAQIPVVVHVAPAGAQAASAGTFITAAAHVAAMASATNIGAAAPVGSGGEDLPETLESKATQDAAAFIRSIGERTGRNPEALAETVLKARSYSASEALEEGIVDLLAEDAGELLHSMDGMRVEVGGREVVLETADLEIRKTGRTALESFLGLIANPNIAFLLLSLGGLGILIELLSPGLLGPGILGVIALALAFVAFGNLPVNWIGVGLILMAMALFFIEMQAPGVGIFGVGGALSFIVGAFLLFGGFEPHPIPTPSFRVSMWMIGGVSAVLFAGLVLLFRAMADSRRAAYESPSGNPVGKLGTTLTSLGPQGSVRVAGETWSAVSATGEPIAEGAEVVVVEMDGLTVKVTEPGE